VVSERFTSRWDTLAFVACVVLALVARAVPESVQAAVAAAVRSTVLAPFLALQERAQWLQSSLTSVGTLVAERDSAVAVALRVEGLDEENARLRQLLDLGSRLTGRAVSAEILRESAPTAGVSVLLSAGADQGVRPLSPVVTPLGLLGIVRSVDAKRSVAVLWTHPDFRVSAMTRDGSVFGLVAPDGATGPNTLAMVLSGVPYRDVVPEGTKLYTSGFGGVYPRGIPIGEVRGVTAEQEGLSRTYRVLAAVHPASAMHVIILVSSPVDVFSAFPEEGR
jgi:rod shape-determining protein MreC